MNAGTCCRAFFDDVREAKVYSHIEKLQNETHPTAHHHRKPEDLLNAAKDYFEERKKERKQTTQGRDGRTVHRHHTSIR